MKFFQKYPLSFVLLCLFIFVMPFWTRHNILTPYSFSGGGFYEYGTIFIFGSSIILILTLVAWAISLIINKQRPKIGNKQVFGVILTLIILAGISAVFSSPRVITIFRWLMFSQVLIIYLLAINLITNKLRLKIVNLVFVISMMGQAILGIIQYLHNGSMGLKIFGETVISPSLAGIAKIIVDGSRHIRAYGTFPHPNVLAAFLVFAGMVMLGLFFSSSGKPRIIYFIGQFILTLALFFTFSRIALAAAIIFWLYFLVCGIKSKKISRREMAVYSLVAIVFLVSLTIIFRQALIPRLDPENGGNNEAVSERMLTYQSAIELCREHPLLGVGIGNFTSMMKKDNPSLQGWQYQPAHNLFLLIAAEVGVLGYLLALALFLVLILSIKTKGRNFYCRLPLLFILAFILLACFDHFFWTTNQGIQIMGFIFALPEFYKARKEEVLCQIPSPAK